MHVVRHFVLTRKSRYLGNQLRKYHNFFGFNSKKVMFWGGESLGYLSQNRRFFSEDLKIFCRRFEDFLMKNRRFFFEELKIFCWRFEDFLYLCSRKYRWL